MVLGILSLFFYRQQLVDEAWKYVGLVLLIGLTIFLAYSWIRKKVGLIAGSRGLWFTTLGFSLLRYLIFCSNWLILLSVMNYNHDFATILSCVGILYLVVSVIPLIQLLDLPVRMLAVMTIFPGEIEIVLLATTLIWMTNTVFPTVLGCALLPFKSRVNLETA